MGGSIEKIWRRRWYSVKSGAWTDEGTRRLYAFVSSGYGAKLRAWFDFVSYILKILNASNTFASLTKLNSFPAKWCSWDVLPTKVSLIKTLPSVAKTNTRMPLHHLWWLARVRMHTCVRPAFASTWSHVLSCLNCLWFESVPTLACGLES